MIYVAHTDTGLIGLGESGGDGEAQEVRAVWGDNSHSAILAPGGQSQGVPGGLSVRFSESGDRVSGVPGTP